MGLLELRDRMTVTTLVPLSVALAVVVVPVAFLTGLLRSRLERGGLVRIVWHHDSRDELRTFQISYLMTGLATAPSQQVSVPRIAVARASGMARLDMRTSGKRCVGASQDCAYSTTTGCARLPVTSVRFPIAHDGALGGRAASRR